MLERGCGALLLMTGTLVALAGCGNPTTSAISGTIAQETFPAAVQRVTILNSNGGRATVPVGASGAFQMTLPKGASYRFFLGDDGKSVPLVIKSDDAGRLETEVTVVSGGAGVDMGSVRFWPGDSSQVRSGTAQSILPPPGVMSGACVNGVFEGSNMPCASGTAPLVCEDDDDEDEDEEDGDNNQCEDGIDPNGNDCDGGPAANQDDGAEGENEIANDASPAEALGMAQFNLPETIGCEDDDEDEDEDEDEDDD